MASLRWRSSAFKSILTTERLLRWVATYRHDLWSAVSSFLNLAKICTLQVVLTFNYKSIKTRTTIQKSLQAKLFMSRRTAFAKSKNLMWTELSLKGVKINGEEYNNTASSLITISLCTIVDLNIEVTNQSGELWCGKLGVIRGEEGESESPRNYYNPPRKSLTIILSNY